MQSVREKAMAVFHGHLVQISLKFFQTLDFNGTLALLLDPITPLLLKQLLSSLQLLRLHCMQFIPSLRSV